MVTEALYRAGYARRADELLVFVDAARLGMPLDASPDGFAAALEQEAVTEGAENAAQLFARDSAVAYATWRRRAVLEVTATLQAIRIGDVIHREAQ